ncbi:MAG: TetR family transcriptional regulator [Crocinitomix sp.]|nr:TetR family transcriptional regulator [Crocinitomix sp.]
MVKDTFNNLPEAKRSAISSAFLKEFTVNKYDDASISKVLKTLNIAKGSFYQYFDNKLSLYQYLIQICGLKKMEYIQHIKREDYEDFWSFWRALYQEGFKLDKDHPKMSNFMITFHDMMNTPTLKEMYHTMRTNGLAGLGAMIQSEVDSGAFRKDVSVEFMAHTLLTTSNGLFDAVRTKNHVEFEQHLTEGRPIFTDGFDQYYTELMENNITLLSQAFNSNS